MTLFPAKRFRPASARDFSERAKNWSAFLDTPLQKTQETLARLYGYAGLHDLQVDLKAAKADPNAHPSGPFDSLPLGDFNRASATEAAAYELLGIDPLIGPNDARAEQSAHLGLFATSSDHRLAIKTAAPRASVLRGIAPRDYGQSIQRPDGSYELRLTRLGQSIVDQIENELLETDGDWADMSTFLRTAMRKHPWNPWLMAHSLNIDCERHHVGMWIECVAFDGELPADVDTRHLRIRSPAAAYELMGMAKSAVRFFRLIYGDPSKNAATSDKHDAFTMTLFNAGMVALLADETDLALEWLTEHIACLPLDNYGARFYLSALNLNRGQGPTWELYLHPPKHGEDELEDRDASEQVAHDPWFYLIRCALALRDGDHGQAKRWFHHAACYTPALLRSIVDSFKAADHFRCWSSHAHLVHLQDFWFRTRPFWDSHPSIRATMQAWATDSSVQKSFIDFHEARSKQLTAIELTPISMAQKLRAAIQSA